MNGKILKGREGNSLPQFYRKETEKLFSLKLFLLTGPSHFKTQTKKQTLCCPNEDKNERPGYQAWECFICDVLSELVLRCSRMCLVIYSRITLVRSYSHWIPQVIPTVSCPL